MKSAYETPRAEKIEFDYTSTVYASGDPETQDNVVKTPGWGTCTIMPNAGGTGMPTTEGNIASKNKKCP